MGSRTLRLFEQDWTTVIQCGGLGGITHSEAKECEEMGPGKAPLSPIPQRLFLLTWPLPGQKRFYSVVSEMLPLAEMPLGSQATCYLKWKVHAKLGQLAHFYP